MKSTDPAFLAALESRIQMPVLFAYLDWPGEAVRAHTGIGLLEWGGETWYGVGGFYSITGGGGGSARSASRMTLALEGLPLDALDEAGGNIRNRSGEIHLGFLAGGRLVSDPALWIAGLMDSRKYSVQASGGDVAARAAVDLYAGSTPRRRVSFRHSQDDQARRNLPVIDGSGRHLARQPDVKLAWPA